MIGPASLLQTRLRAVASPLMKWAFSSFQPGRGEGASFTYRPGSPQVGTQSLSVFMAPSAK